MTVSMATVEPAYLDWNATAPLVPAARAAVLAALDCTGNPSSVHGVGRAAGRMVADAREAIAALSGVAPAGIVFTSGGTEANALALHQAPDDRPVAVSAIEHDSLLAPLASAEPPAADRLLRLPVNSDGVVDLAVAADLIARHRPGLVSLMLANNETGVIQPVARVAELARAAGALMHCDCVQAPGRMACDLPSLGVHMLSLSAHKLGGPKGAGALVLADGMEIRPLLLGGGQERRRRAGTEAVPAIAGFGAAAAQAVAGWPAAAQRMTALRDRLEAAALAAMPGAIVWGQVVARLPNTTALALPGMPAETQVIALDLAGVAVSAGSACSSGKVSSSHVLAAMAAGPLAGESLRVSLGPTTSEVDVDRFLAAWTRLASTATRQVA